MRPAAALGCIEAASHVAPPFYRWALRPAAPAPVDPCEELRAELADLERRLVEQGVAREQRQAEMRLLVARRRAG